MNTIKIISLLALTLFISSCKGQSKDEIKTPTQSISKIEVLDFHSTHRCMTCIAIEENTRYTLETYFEKELKEGSLSFQTVNIDEKENEKLAEKFQAVGTSLYFNIIKNGKERQVDLTEFAFMYGNEKEKFSEELKNKINTQLKML